MRRLLYVQRDRLAFPIDTSKWDALSARFDVRVVAGEATGAPDARFVPFRGRGGPLFYLTLPFRVARELRRFRPDVVVAQTPYEGAAVLLARPRARVVVDVHGDWRVSTRRYGSPLRRLAAPLGDRLAAWSLRRADGLRTISPWTTSLAPRAPLAEFPTYSDLSAFGGPVAPLPDGPRALYVGVLEPVKNVAVLAAAWRSVEGAELHVVGDGSQREPLTSVADRWDRRLPAAGVAAALDAATLLVLPSASEGFGRVVVEAFRRGRPVVASRVGSLPDLVEDGVNGLLVEPGDAAALAAALQRVLGDRGLAERLAAGAAASAERWALSAEQHAERTAELVEAVLA